MKKLLLMTGAILMFTLGIAQTNFIWEKTDSVSKKQSQLYTETKMFIATEWKSAKDVIQNDDKEGGIILIKALHIKRVLFNPQNYCIYTYSYNVTFKMKDGKYKIVLDNVNCESANLETGQSQTKIPPFDGDNCPPTGGIMGVKKKNIIPMMAELKNDLQAIVENYEKYIKTTNKNEW